MTIPFSEEWKRECFEKHICDKPLTKLEKWYGERMAAKGREEIRKLSEIAKVSRFSS